MKKYLIAAALIVSFSVPCYGGRDQLHHVRQHDQKMRDHDQRTYRQDALQNLDSIAECYWDRKSTYSIAISSDKRFLVLAGGLRQPNNALRTL